MTADPLQFQAFRKQLQARGIAVGNIVNLARTIFKKGVLVKYSVVDGGNVVRLQYANVEEVVRDGAEVYLVVIPLKAKKPRRIRVEDVLGVIQEG